MYIAYIVASVAPHTVHTARSHPGDTAPQPTCATMRLTHTPSLSSCRSTAEDTNHRVTDLCVVYSNALIG
jgi:hypothetical protein